ncbi:tetratricopeptide repeat protein [Prosthecobacter vanneervenii]|uniref:Tetratricopeptide (TPR) repeat protein n=1 Tax=Prosthecobacter vanneervenii TaxID=48466 RepID=A0A7W7YCX8_9BACT|nr:tetratricopeptide (TPR) repeat protein [Prosthecobacter vanneervenii]
MAAAPAQTFPDWAGTALILVVTLLAYYPALPGGFLWDDEEWTKNIEELRQSWHGLWRMWSDFKALQQYYPVSGTTFWIDGRLWGSWTFPYHVENVLLHGIAAVMFWRLLRRLEVRGAFLAGALFAWHPVMVESVAWVTERKNVLSMVFYLGAFLAYGHYTGFWKEETPPRRRCMYGLALGLFVLALLAKITVFAFPVALALLCWWRRGTLRWRQDLLPLIPFLVISVVVGAGISWLEKYSVGAVGNDWDWTFAERILIAGHALWFYARQMFFPVGQSFIYVQWHPDAGSWWHWVCALSALAVIVGVWLARKKVGRGVVVAVWYFAGTLFPLLGFMNVYGMRFSVVADHWVYLPGMSLIVLAAYALAGSGKLLGKRGELACMVVVLALMPVLAWRQTWQYQGMEALWLSTLEKNPQCWLAHNNYGILLVEDGRLDAGISHYREALKHRPDYAEGFNNLATALMKKGATDEALQLYRKAVSLNPGSSACNFDLGNTLLQKGEIDEAMQYLTRALELRPSRAETLNSLATALTRKGEIDEAIKLCRKALELRPDYPEAHNNLGFLLLRKNEIDEAMQHCRRAIELRPGYAEAQNNLGNAFLQQGRIDDAIPCYREAQHLQPESADAPFNLGNAHLMKGQIDASIDFYEQALKLRPAYAEASYSLGNAWMQKRRLDKAVEHFQTALKAAPDHIPTLNNLAWILATSREASLRDGAAAVELMLHADKIAGGTSPVIKNTLAAAYAEAGRFDDARVASRQAADLALQQGNTDLSRLIREEQILFESGRPFRDSGP